MPINSASEIVAMSSARTHVARERTFSSRPRGRSTAIRRLAVEIDESRPIDCRAVDGRQRLLRAGRNERTRQVHEHRAQMRSVPHEIHGADSRAEQEGERRLIALHHVAAGTGEDEVVATIVRRLPSSRRDVIERHDRRREADAAVRADGTVLGQQPSARLDICVAARWMRR